MKENKGFDVQIWYKKDSPFGEVSEIRHNVTEIHYLYKSLIGQPDSVAFESDIHATGGTVKIEFMKEFEAKLSTVIAENY